MEQKSSYPNIKQLLANTKVSSIASPKGGAVIIRSTETTYEGFKKLLEHHILSAPVLDVNTNKYTGFLDMRDLASFVVFVDDDQHSDVPSNLQDILIRGCKLLKQPTDGVTCTYLSRRNPFHQVQLEDTLLHVCEILAKGVHRVPVVDAKGQVVNIVSQSTVVNFLNTHIKEHNIKSELGKTIKELNLGSKPVITVHKDTSAIDTFRLMDRKKLSSVAVVDNDGKFIGNTSASDLKLFIKTLSLDLLHHPIMTYLNQIRQESIEIKSPTISVSGNDTLAVVIGKLASTRVHKLFVADDVTGYKPDQCISLTDILKLIVKS